MIKRGDRVYIAKLWQDVGDENIEFYAVEDEDGGRVRIEARIGLAINPQSVIATWQLERCADCREALGKNQNGDMVCVNTGCFLFNNDNPLTRG